MSTLQPEQASLICHTVSIPTLTRENATTLQIIRAIPADKGDYRPDPNSKSALELAWHMATAEHRFLACIADGAFNFDPFPRPESTHTPAGVSDWYSQTFNANMERISKMSGEQLAKVLDFRGLVQLPAVLFLQFNINHIVHHRGQLSTYLRPMGSKVPNIYGESYDGAEARKAAQAKSA